jgi:hypothetical protein
MTSALALVAPPAAPILPFAESTQRRHWIFSPEDLLSIRQQKRELAVRGLQDETPFNSRDFAGRDEFAESKVRLANPRKRERDEEGAGGAEGQPSPFENVLAVEEEEALIHYYEIKIQEIWNQDVFQQWLSKRRFPDVMKTKVCGVHVHWRDPSVRTRAEATPRSLHLYVL